MLADADAPLSREDRFIRSNHHRLLASAGAFALWQLADVLREVTASGAAHASLRVLSLGAWGAWCIVLVLQVLDGRRIKHDAALRSAMNDERARDVRLRAYRVGFWAALGSAALLGIPGAAHVLPAFAATRLVVVASAATFMVACVYFDRE